MSQKPTGTVVIILRPNVDVKLHLKWAECLAASHGLDLLILHRLDSRENHVEEISLEEPGKGKTSGVVDDIRRVIEESEYFQAGSRKENGHEDEASSEGKFIHVRLKMIYFTNFRSLREALLAQLVKEKVEIFTQVYMKFAGVTDVDFIKERRLFLRYIPCKVVLCTGLKEKKDLSRILVLTGTGSNEEAAMQLGQKLAALPGGKLTALHVNPNVGGDSMAVGERRLERHINSSIGLTHLPINRRVVVDSNINRGIRHVWEEGNNDLIVKGVPVSDIEGSFSPKFGKEATVVLVSAASPLANRFKKFLEESVQRVVPQIERSERISLLDRIQPSSEWNFDFLTLMVLSTAIAAIGLIQNSAAVVIGAMLVAPLMTPLLGLGLALVQGNLVLAKMSLRSISLGLCVSLTVGFLVGLCTSGFVEPTREMLARGGPGLLDLNVAALAGLAAAYATSRTNLIAALPGVAIAAALVPPIATSGLALSLGHFSLSFGAFMLFGINMATIVLASMVSLWAVGCRTLKKPSHWIEICRNVVIVMVLALALLLSFEGREHSLTEEPPPGLLEDVQKTLGEDYRLESLAVAYDELGVQLNVLVTGKAPAPEQLATDVRKVARDHYEDSVRVRLLTKINSVDGKSHSDLKP